MTSLTLALSRSLAYEITEGDEIIVTRLDHDANISPWMQIAEARGATIRWLDFDVEDCTLLQDQFDELLSEQTRLVALGYASNAVGTVNPIKTMINKSREVGALTYIDAVQYAPHGPIDVQDLDCDFLVISAYKFFGPHMGLLYGKYEHLDRLRAYKVRPAPDDPPGKFETGTKNHEGIAGVLGAIEYLASIGDRYGIDSELNRGRFEGRALQLQRAMHVIQQDEIALTVPTVSFTMDDHSPREIAEHLAKAGINVWDGNYYALAVTERLGLEDTGGMLRVGLVHYNSSDEIQRLHDALQALT
jgi:cysteine desulfurase family protein (TIGR01976 family)